MAPLRTRLASARDRAPRPGPSRRAARCHPRAPEWGSSGSARKGGPGGNLRGTRLRRGTHEVGRGLQEMVPPGRRADGPSDSQPAPTAPWTNDRADASSASPRRTTLPRERSVANPRLDEFFCVEFRSQVARRAPRTPASYRLATLVTSPATIASLGLRAKPALRPLWLSFPRDTAQYRQRHRQRQAAREALIPAPISSRGRPRQSSCGLSSSPSRMRWSTTACWSFVRWNTRRWRSYEGPFSTIR